MRNHKGRTKTGRKQSFVQLEHIEAIEKRLWNAADTLAKKVLQLPKGVQSIYRKRLEKNEIIGWHRLGLP